MKSRHCGLAFCFFALALLAGCLQAGEPPTPTEDGVQPPAAIGSSLYGPARAAVCDPDLDCEVSSQYVTCNDGVIMFAWWSDNQTWCINRDVCDRHGGSTVCPF
jgi:hypothetical protein